MDSAFLAIQVFVLVLVSAFGPGLLIVSRLRFSPLEKLCGAVAASLIVTYLASLGLFCLKAGPAAYWATSAAFALLGIFAWRQAAVLFRRRATRAAMLAMLAVWAWEFLHLCIARRFGGAAWAGDWWEHFDRVRYFLGELPDNFAFANTYYLPARPPMMNLLAAFVCKQTGMNFQVFSLTFLLLNGLAFLPCCLVLGHLRRRGSRCIAILAILFMLNPSILQNATWTWTKALAAGLVVMAVCFYLRGLRSRYPHRIFAAALCLAAGILVHYSALPFAIVIALHYLLTLLSRRRQWGRALVAASGAILLLASWFLWSISHFGMELTFFSNTTAVGSSTRSLAQNLDKFFYNAFTNLVPHPLHPIPDWRIVWPWVYDKSWGGVRDYYFLMCQTTLPMMIGAVAGWVAIGLFLGLLRRGPGRAQAGPARRFWLWFVLAGFVLGTAANPEWEAWGSAQVTLQPLVLVGLAWVAVWIGRLSAPVFWAVFAGLVVDYGLGILLHFNRLAQIFPQTSQGEILPRPELGHGQEEYAWKVWAHYTFWGDRLATVGPALQIASAALAVYLLVRLVRLRGQLGRGRRTLS